MPRRSLTLNACTTCRKKRTKCDGDLPCSRCKSRREKCHYEDREWQTKEHLRSELKRLKRQNQDTQTVLTAILTPSQHAILQRLRAGEGVESIAWSLTDSQREAIHNLTGGGTVDNTQDISIDLDDHLDPLDPLDHPSPLTEPNTPRAIDDHPATEAWASTCPPPGRPILPIATETQPFPANFQLNNPNAYSCDWYPPSIESCPAVSDFSSTYAPSPTANLSQTSRSNSYASEGADNTSWTQAPHNVPSANRLIELFFAWEVVPFSMVCQHLFLRDYTDGSRDYCSPALVSAIMSLASLHLANDEVTRFAESSSWSERFFHESTSILAAEGPASTLPSIQALGLLALREMCCGREAQAESLVLGALDGIAAMNPEDAGPEGREKDYYTARAITLSGVLSLSRMIHIVTNHLSTSSTYPLHDGQMYQQRSIIQQPETAPRFEKAIETLEGIVQRVPESQSPGNFIFGLTELVYSLLYRIHGSESQKTNELPRVYQKCLSWYASVSETLKDSGKPTPYVLFVHIYFHLCLLALFRPFVHLQQHDDDATSCPSPRTICAEAAQAILSLTQSYSRLFTLRRTPCLIPYFVSAAGLMHLTLEAPGPGPAEAANAFAPSPAASFSSSSSSSYFSSSPSSSDTSARRSSISTTASGDAAAGDDLCGLVPPPPPNQCPPLSQAVLQLAGMDVGHPAAARAGWVLRDMRAVGAFGGGLPSPPGGVAAPVGGHC